MGPSEWQGWGMLCLQPTTTFQLAQLPKAMTQASRMPIGYRTMGPLLIVMASGWGRQGSSMLSAQSLAAPAPTRPSLSFSRAEAQLLRLRVGGQREEMALRKTPSSFQDGLHLILVYPAWTVLGLPLSSESHPPGHLLEGLLRCYWACLLLSTSLGEGSLHRLQNI